MLGELELLGYSAYLHPVSDDLLLGVGQDASAEGRRLGTQLSLFDVSDLRNPKRLAQASLGAGSSTTAEFDPHAFLFWKPANLAVIPLSVYGSSEGGTPFDGAIGFKVGAASLAEAGRITHPAAPRAPAATRRRSPARSSSATGSTRCPTRACRRTASTRSRRSRSPRSRRRRRARCRCRTCR